MTASSIQVSKNGTVYSFPAKVVASHRALYYSERDAETNFNAEYDLAMNDFDELIDWAQNNMDPEDIDVLNVNLVATGKPPTFEDCWTSDEEWEVIPTKALNS